MNKVRKMLRPCCKPSPRPGLSLPEDCGQTSSACPENYLSLNRSSRSLALDMEGFPLLG